MCGSNLVTPRLIGGAHAAAPAARRCWRRSAEQSRLQVFLRAHLVSQEPHPAHEPRSYAIGLMLSAGQKAELMT